MAKLCFVVATPTTIKCFLIGHLRALGEHRIVLVADFDSVPRISGFPPNNRCVQIRIQRKIDLRQDWRAVLKLYSLMRRERFDLVYSQTPKAGLLAMLAAWAARVPIRIHAFTGQVWATQSGWFRAMLKALDRVIVACSSEVLIDSPSQRDFLLREGVARAERSSVIAFGSICGVDTFRFRPNATARKAIRERFGIPKDAFTFLFMGRMYREKGVYELVEAFRRLLKMHPDARLLMVGPDEDGVVPALGNLTGVLIHGRTDKPEDFFASADVFCLPSHREGFGSVIIEAAACGIPAIGSNIYGISDAIADGETGLLHEVCNPTDLERCMRTFIEDRELAAQMGRRALARAMSMFSSERVVGGFVDYINLRLQTLEGRGQ